MLCVRGTSRSLGADGVLYPYLPQGVRAAISPRPAATAVLSHVFSPGVVYISAANLYDDDRHQLNGRCNKLTNNSFIRPFFLLVIGVTVMAQLTATITDTIQAHPYISLVAGFMIGYGIISYTNPTPTNTTVAPTTAPTVPVATGVANIPDSSDDQFPDTNPLAGLNLQERTGIMNPVRYNQTTDVRGEPQGVRDQQVPVESSFMKNPRGTEARIDEIEVKSLRKPRAIEY